MKDKNESKCKTTITLLKTEPGPEIPFLDNN